LREPKVQKVITMNKQNVWREQIISSFKDPNTWDAIKDKPLQERVSLILETYGKLYQQPNNPYQTIAFMVSDMRRAISLLDLSKIEKKEGIDFIVAVLGLFWAFYQKVKVEKENGEFKQKTEEFGNRAKEFEKEYNELKQYVDIYGKTEDFRKRYDACTRKKEELLRERELCEKLKEAVLNNMKAGDEIINFINDVKK